MKKVLFREALCEALHEEMERDNKVIYFGEDARIGSGFHLTDGVYERFGGDRIIDTPISEVAIVGLIVGSALCGLRPIAEIMFNDFILLASDQIVNQMAKLRYMSGGQFKIPAVIRTSMGGGLSAAAQHSQCFDGIFTNIPGLKVVCPSTSRDAKGLFKSAIRDDNPVLFFEHIQLYNIPGEIPESEYLIPIGKAEVKKEGKDLTLIGTSIAVIKCLEIAEELKKENIDIEVIDPRTLVPLDFETILNSIKKTGRAIVVYPGYRNNGTGAEIAARIADEAFEFLDAPIKRVASVDVPIPFSPNLEKKAMLKKEEIKKTIYELL